MAYVKEPAFRAAVMEFTQHLVENQQRALFGNQCGQCGNSCRRPAILVREGEILALQSRLGLDEPTFRDRYLAPAFTWNPGDAVFRQADGACPFLSSDGSDRPLNAVCTVYEDRPQSCREFRSDQSFCRKDLGVIMQELSLVCVHPTQVHAYLKDGSRVSLPTDPDMWARLWAAFQAIADEPEPTTVGPELPLEQAPSPAPPPRLSGLEWLILEESAMALKLAGRESIPLSLEPALPEVQALLAAVLQRPEDELQKYLGSPQPNCLICGECCGAFTLEIVPTDAHRLAQALHVSYAEFVEQRTRPGLFTWNPYNRILLKRTAPRYTKRLAELRVLDGQTDERCQFLERHDNGFFLCGVYEHRPQMCRDFAPTQDLCRRTNAVQNWGRQARNLRSLKLTADTLFIQAVGQEVVQQHPRHRWPEVDAAARALELTVVTAVSP